MTAPLYTMNAASDLLEKDRRLIARVLRNIAPDSRAAGKSRWRLSVIVDALLADVQVPAAAPGLTEARTRQAVAKAAQAEFDLAVDQGGWCKTIDAVEWMRAILIVVKERLLTLSGELQGMLDAEQGELLDNRIREALQELSDPCTFMTLSKQYNAEDRAKQARKDSEVDKGGAADEPKRKGDDHAA